MAPSDCVPDDSWFSSWTLPGCQEPDSIVTSVIKGSVLEPWVEDAKNGVGDTIKTLVTFHLSIPDPNVGDTSGGTSSVITFLRDQLAWFGAALMAFVVLFQVGRIVFDHRDHGVKLIFGMLAAYLTVALVSIPATVAGLLITGEISARILEASTIGTNFADNLFSLFSNEAGFTSSILLLGLLLISMLISGFLCLLMIGRGGAIFVILGVLLTTASASATESGKEGLKTQIGWLEALILYKLAASAIYGIGFQFLGTDTAAEGNGLLQILYGLTLLMMAIFALPALMRICAPATAPINEGRGVGGAVAGATPAIAAASMAR